MTEQSTTPEVPDTLTQGSRVSGKGWKVQKNAFRVKSLGVGSKWAKKQEQRLKDQQVKAKLKELKQEKEDEKKARIDAMKERREKKAEKERYEMMAAKMHAKKVERMRKKEKRNKLLKEGR
ncbi:CYFA0S01e06348g1_1 [Cyberlindnera fabianii]|uniref:rRNA-processing protein n=1 Tax=Cyberlindnera fabianii TaxID=36022 RepID=A0A061AHG7_CYBFA|nr:rRNA-processing protein CGR1 [Cyberlindnera fabianii]CDR37004.1 CYFA0S01e06348g1_1 [Cyberlindnera fabianii]